MPAGALAGVAALSIEKAKYAFVDFTIASGKVVRDRGGPARQSEAGSVAWAAED